MPLKEIWLTSANSLSCFNCSTLEEGGDFSRLKQEGEPSLSETGERAPNRATQFKRKKGEPIFQLEKQTRQSFPFHSTSS